MTNKAALLIIPLLTMVSCNNAPIEEPTEPTPVTAIQGSVQSGSVGEILKLMGSDGQVLTSTTLESNKEFTSTLPIPSTQLQEINSTLNQLGCSSQLQTPTDLKGLTLASGTLPDGKSVTPTSVSSTLLTRTIETRAWLYSNINGNVSGQIDCAGATGNAMKSIPVNVNLQLQSGWNSVLLKINGSLGLSGLQASGQLTNTTNTSSVWLTPQEIRNKLGF